MKVATLENVLDLAYYMMENDYHAIETIVHVENRSQLEAINRQMFRMKFSNNNVLPEDVNELNLLIGDLKFQFLYKS